MSDTINSGGFTENAYVFVCLNTPSASAQTKQKSAAERQREEKQDRKKQKPQKRKSPAVSGAFSEYGRRDRIRTYDPLVPNQLRYQAALLAESGMDITAGKDKRQEPEPEFFVFRRIIFISPVYQPNFCFLSAYW